MLEEINYKCPFCDIGALKKIQKNISIPLYNGTNITVYDIIFEECNSCGEQLFNKTASKMIEDAILKQYPTYFVNIIFPADEINSLKSRLSSNKYIYTTRVDKEYDRYKEGNIHYAPQLNICLKVESSFKFTNLLAHPFVEELTIGQIEELSKYDKFNLLKLSKI
jgi:YgiT-type zinc finger domain-containing protein